MKGTASVIHIRKALLMSFLVNTVTRKVVLEKFEQSAAECGGTRFKNRKNHAKTLWVRKMLNIFFGSAFLIF